MPGPVRYHWGSIVELEVPLDGTPGLMALHPHNTNSFFLDPNVLQSTDDHICFFVYFVFESTLLARQLHQERTQMEAQ